MSQELDILKGLVEMNANNENECRDALKPLAKYLTYDSNLDIEKGEYINHDGRVDLLLVVKPFSTQVPGAPEMTFNDGIVFELKSPKKPIFKFDSQSKRFLPSYELSLAETQLFNYVQSLEENNGDLFYKYQVKKVKVGGIIIGRDETKFLYSEKDEKLFSSQNEFNNQKRLSLHSRHNLMYEKSKIYLFTWDDIIKLIEKNMNK